MRLIAATLFEFSLRETVRRGERAAGQPQRRVRMAQAARRLYALRAVQASLPGRRGATARRRARWTERRAQAALTHVGFADPQVAADVLRQLQVRTLTAALARLDYTTPAAARTVLANLITARPATPPRHGTPTMPNGSRAPAHPAQSSRPAAPPSGRADVNGRLRAVAGARPPGRQTTARHPDHRRFGHPRSQWGRCACARARSRSG